ncbi:MAG: cysteine-rich CWC family protein [Mangrovibacterium sp.]
MKQYWIKYEPRSCPRCGKLFRCTANSDCWCLSVQLSARVQDYIAARYEGCLCKNCLLELTSLLKDGLPDGKNSVCRTNGIKKAESDDF